MELQERKAIYLQLADRLCLDILQGVYKADERIPSVREFSAQMEVNANTAVRAYDWMQQQGVIYTRRGLGYFVAEDACHIIATMRKREFMDDSLPQLFTNMRALGISIAEVAELWYAFNKEQEIRTAQGI